MKNFKIETEDTPFNHVISSDVCTLEGTLQLPYWQHVL